MMPFSLAVSFIIFWYLINSNSLFDGSGILDASTAKLRIETWLYWIKEIASSDLVSKIIGLSYIQGYTKQLGVVGDYIDNQYLALVVGYGILGFFIWVCTLLSIWHRIHRRITPGANIYMIAGCALFLSCPIIGQFNILSPLLLLLAIMAIITGGK